MIEILKQLIKEKMGINTSHVNERSLLGETGVGLDSQEIIDFMCILDKQFHIKLPPGFTKRNTIEDVISVIKESQKNLATSSPQFEHKIEASLEIKCLPKEAYLAIYEMEKWPEKLPHVKHIETLYNDGIYQEFLMDVQSETGLIQVRSIRRCIPDEGITFFQPKPPKFLKHHCGGWSFHQAKTGCLVKTWHQWNLNPQQATQIFPPDNTRSTKERIAHVLQSHAELALTTWKDRLEAK